MSEVVARLRVLLEGLSEEDQKRVAVLAADVAGRPDWLPGTFTLEWRKCGKERCRCRIGGAMRHGPYVYLARRSGGRVVKTYLGRGR